MPMIRYCCKNCANNFSIMYRSVKDIKTPVPCKKCGGEAVRQLSAPASASVVRVDNGVQAKAVEVNFAIIESNKEMSKKV